MKGFCSNRKIALASLCILIALLSFPSPTCAGFQKKLEDHLSALNIPMGADYQIFTIGNTLRNVFISMEDGGHKSYLLDVSGSEQKDIESIIKQGKYCNFRALILQTLKKKYPKFIVDAVAKGADAAYDVNRNFIRVYYSNFQSSPAYDREVYVTLNASDVRGIVTFPMSQAQAADENTLPLDPDLPAIALTFDDGPVGRSGTLLGILRDNKANATFYIQGKAIGEHPDIISKGLEYGNEYGSHTYSHANLAKLSKDDIREQLDATDACFYELTGRNLQTVRPPYGKVNPDALQALGLPCVLWSVDTKDWSKRDADHLIDYILENASDGDIVLCHDIYPSTVAAMETILPELYVRGIQVTTVSNLAKLKGKTLEPNVIYKSMK